MNQNWTREPLTKEARFGHADGARWVLKSKSTDRVAVVSVGGVGSPEIAQANADRLIDCWNAMLGIPDPAGFVERAKKMEAVLKQIDDWSCDCPDYMCTCDGKHCIRSFIGGQVRWLVAQWQRRVNDD